MRLLRRAGLNSDVHSKSQPSAKVFEGRCRWGDHAKASAHEEVPVAHAAHLLTSVGCTLETSARIDHDLRGLDVLGGVYGELGEVLVEQAAAVLRRDLVELIIGDGLVDAVDVVAQGADGLSRGLKVVLSQSAVG